MTEKRCKMPSCNWLQKFKSKRRSQRDSSPLRTLASSATVTGISSGPCNDSTKGIKERLWNQAYNELRLKECELFEAYEKFLSAELQNENTTLTSASPNAATGNNISPDPQKRWRQMNQLVQVGLQRTERSAAIKQKINDGLQYASPVKGLIVDAVKASPEASIAWVGACFGLQVGSIPV